MKKSLFTMLALLFTGLLAAAPVENPWTPKKKKIIDEIRSMILDLLKLWGICDIISY